MLLWSPPLSMWRCAMLLALNREACQHPGRPAVKLQQLVFTCQQSCMMVSAAFG